METLSWEFARKVCTQGRWHSGDGTTPTRFFTSTASSSRVAIRDSRPSPITARHASKIPTKTHTGQERQYLSQRIAGVPSVAYNDVAEKRLEKVEEVRELLRRHRNEAVDAVVLIDKLQRLGIDYHFRDEIERLLLVTRDSLGNQEEEAHHSTLHFVALSFRLLRQHGYYVSTSVLSRFRNISDGRWEIDHHDIDGILALFEASFVRLEGEEDILDEARNFCQCYLRTLVGDHVEPLSIRREIEYVLDHPFHLSIPRFNIKNYLEITSGTSTTEGKNGIIYELAKLDFNIVQSMHQRELHEVARWWGASGVGNELKLARQNYLEWFMWPLIAAPEPQYSAFRVEMAKPVAFLFLIDDIFDIYGTLDELILFTEAVERWEVESSKRLPRFMKMSFMALYNTTNDIADKVLKEHGWNPIEPLRETWAAMCRAFLAEKRWLTSGNLPESEVYLRNGMISSGVPMSLIHMFVMLGEGKEETMNLLATLNLGLIAHTAMIFRLWNDMKNVKVHGKDDKECGHDGSYADCYLKECVADTYSSSTSLIENVEEHVMQRLNDAWKKLNRECLFANPYSSSLRTASLNIARMAGITYSYDDVQRPVALRELACSLLMENIPL